MLPNLVKCISVCSEDLDCCTEADYQGNDDSSNTHILGNLKGSNSNYVSTIHSLDQQVSSNILHLYAEVVIKMLNNYLTSIIIG